MEDRRGPVAIIGMACRFAGARDPAELHDVAVAGHRLFQRVAGLPGHQMSAALLDEWTIPAVSFGDPELGPQDLGPVQKLAIASVAPGVCELVRAESGLTCSAPYPRAAYHSSLHAVVAAADALQAGELDLAVAGGVELGIDPVWLALQVRAGTLGTDEMRVYAADSAGLLPGEGCGVVVLARTADARAAGMPVYAEIAGWSTWPALIPAVALAAAAPAAAAYRQAGIDPADVQFIEGQGTGTSTGDSDELAALMRLRRGGSKVAALGAVSAGIGYTKAAAGIASLIRTATAMTAGTIPPGTGCGRPHPLLEPGQALLRMPARPEPWPDGTRLAAVNSLGTADPAVKPGFPGAQNAEGVHLVLRRPAMTVDHAAPLRVTLTAATRAGLAAGARYAARLLRAGETTRGATEPGVHVSAGATGTTVVIFPGRPEAGAPHPALLTASLSTTGIRELARHAGALGIPVEVLSGTTAMHSPAMARYAAPLRSILAGTRASPPQRRLISTISGQPIRADEVSPSCSPGRPASPCCSRRR